MPLRTALTEMLGIEHPIIQGGMQYVGYAEMASAVSNAGGLGILTVSEHDTRQLPRYDTRQPNKSLCYGYCIWSPPRASPFSRPYDVRSLSSLLTRLIRSAFQTPLRLLRFTHPRLDHHTHTHTHTQGLTQPTPEALRAEIRRCRTLTSKPFGVNLTILPSLIPADYDAYAAVIAEERVTMVEVAGGSPKKYMKMWHDAGVKVLHKSATIRHALKAQSVGVDLVEVVGYEGSIAGGQPGDEVGAWVMLAKATALLDIPVIAAGASGTGRQLAAALAMGAHGITMATRFLATVEAPIHPRIKEALASPDTDERSTTIVMRELNNATRVFKNDVSLKINEILAEPEKDFSLIKDYATGLRTKDMWQVNGSWDDAMWSCGQSVGLIDDVPTCKALVERMVAEAEQQLTSGVRAVVASRL